MRDSLTLLRTPVSVIFSFAPKSQRAKITTQLSSCCNAFWDNIYPFTMPGPGAELMTREKKIFLENDISPTYGYVTKLFLESEFQHKGNKQTKKSKFSAGFFAETDSENKIIYYTEKDKNIWKKFSSLGQEPTFNVCLTLYNINSACDSKLQSINNPCSALCHVTTLKKIIS